MGMTKQEIAVVAQFLGRDCEPQADPAQQLALQRLETRLNALAFRLDSRSKPTICALTAVRAYFSTVSEQNWRHLSPRQPVPWNKESTVDNPDSAAWCKQFCEGREPTPSKLHYIRSKLVPSRMPHFSDGWITHRTFSPFDAEWFRGSLCKTDADVMSKFRKADATWRAGSQSKVNGERAGRALQPCSTIKNKKTRCNLARKARKEVNRRFGALYTGYTFPPTQLHRDGRQTTTAQTPLLFPVRDTVSLSLMAYALRHQFAVRRDASKETASLPTALQFSNAAKALVYRQCKQLMRDCCHQKYESFTDQLEAMSNDDMEKIRKNVADARCSVSLLAKPDSTAVMHECACIFGGCHGRWRAESSPAVQYVAATAIRWQLLMMYQLQEPVNCGANDWEEVFAELATVQMQIRDAVDRLTASASS